jgi:hypothetical protein
MAEVEPFAWVSSRKSSLVGTEFFNKIDTTLRRSP